MCFKGGGRGVWNGTMGGSKEVDLLLVRRVLKQIHEGWFKRFSRGGSDHREYTKIEMSSEKR
jgi:hypothetical protein